MEIVIIKNQTWIKNKNKLEFIILEDEQDNKVSFSEKHFPSIKEMDKARFLSEFTLKVEPMFTTEQVAEKVQKTLTALRSGKTSFSRDEVVELLAAYRLSDMGTYTVEETKQIWKNSFVDIKATAEQWLNETAYVSIKERAESYFTRLGNVFREVTRNNNKGKTDEEIYCDYLKR